MGSTEQQNWLLLQERLPVLLLGTEHGPCPVWPAQIPPSLINAAPTQQLRGTEAQ